MHWFLKTILADDGSTMAFLQGRGVDVSVIQFVLSQTDPKTKGNMVSVLAKNPTVTVQQLQQMVPQKVQQEANAPAEMQLVQRFQDPEFQKWLLVNLRKMRAAAGNKRPQGMPPTVPGLGLDLYYLIDNQVYPLHDVANDIATWAQEIWDWYRGCIIASRQAIMGINDPEQVATILAQYGIENPNMNLASLDFATALDYSDEWHELMAGRGSGRSYYGEKPEDTVYGPQWSNPQWQGWTIKQVKTENNLLAEGNKVGHCVGGQDYCRRVARGDTRIFSLRDPSNVPYVTMEVYPDSWHFNQIFGNGPKSGNADPHDNLKGMIGEWMKTLPGVTIEGADGFDYGELKYDNSPEQLEKAIYGGLEGYGIQKDISNFDINDAYESILKTMEDGRDNYAPRDTRYIADVLARAAVDADMARVKNGTFAYKNVEREATALMKRDRKNYKAKDVKRIPPEIYQNLMAQVMTEWNDMRLQEEQEWWLRGKSQQERRAKFDQRRNEIVLDRYNNELKYPNAQTLADVPPEEADRFLRTTVDKRSSIDQVDNIRQKNSEQLWENWDRADPEHVDRDEYNTDEAYEAAVEKAEQEAQDLDDEAQEDHMRHYLPYALDSAMYEKTIEAMRLKGFRLPRWMVQRWGKAGTKPGLMWMYDQSRKVKIPRKKKLAMNWYKSAAEMGLFGQDPTNDPPLPDQGNRPLFDVSKIPARVPRGTDVMEELDNVSDLKSALALLDQYGIGYDTIQWPGGASPVYVFESPNGETTVLEFDQGVLGLSEANQWVTDLNDLSLDNYVPMPDFNDEFWAGVGAGSKLYHGTNRDYVDSILRRGLDPRSETRGLSNKFTGDAVFMSESPEGTVPYGDMVIEIDVGAMKAAGYMPQVSGEEPLADDQQREAIAWRLGLEDYHVEDRGWEGIAPDTIVMYGRIPAKFVRVLK